MQYTNEELALKIQAGQTGYLPILWEQVQAFVWQQAGRWRRAWRDGRPWIEADDFYQCGYPALVEAVKTYKQGEGNSFLGWFLLYLRTEFSVEVGCRTVKQRNEPLNNAVSVDTPIGGEDDDFTIGDTLADPVDRYAPIEDEVCSEQVKPVIAAALDDLPERERQVLNLRYMENLPWAETGKRLGITLTYANAIGKDAIRHIREGSHMQALSEAFYHTKNLYNGTGFHAWKRTGSSAQETFVLKKEHDDARARRWLHSDNPEQQLRYYMDYLGFSRELAEKIVEVRNKE